MIIQVAWLTKGKLFRQADAKQSELTFSSSCLEKTVNKRSRHTHEMKLFKLSVKGTSPLHLLENEGLFTQESQPARIFGEVVGGIFALDSLSGSDWSNGLAYQASILTPTEIKL